MDAGHGRGAPVILEQVNLRNWRSFRGDGHHFSFAEGANLLIGPNESGKSTVLEAVRRGLLDRHTSRGKDILAVRPVGSSLGPEVRLVFRDGGRRYAVRKRFLGDPMSEVRVERDGEFQLDHEGDAADRFLRSLLLAEDPKRGSLRPEQRGPAQALWFLQDEDDVPSGSWSDALEAGLRDELAKGDGSGIAGLLRVAQDSSQVERMEASLAEQYEEHFTPTGRPKAQGPVARLESRLVEIDDELEQRRSEQERAAQHRRELRAIEQADRELVARLQSLAERRHALEESLDQEGTLVAEHRELEKLCESAQRRAARGRTKRLTVEALDRRIAELEQTQREGEEAEIRLQVSVREHRRAAERHARMWEDELSPKLEKLRSEITDLRAKQRIEQLETEIRQLDRRIERRDEVALELEQSREQWERSVQVSDEVWQKATELDAQVRSTQERVRAAGIRLGLDQLPQDAVRFDPQPERDPATGEWVVSEDTRVAIEGVGSFTVRSADERLATYAETARRVRDQRDALLARFGAEDLGALEAMHRTSADLLRQVERAEALHSEVHQGRRGAESDAQGAGLEKRRAELRLELEDLLERCPQSVLPGMEGWAEERTLDELQRLETESITLERQIREEREAEQTAQQRSLEAHERLMAVSKQTSARSSERAALRERLANELETFVDRAQFEADLDELEQQAVRLSEELQALDERIRVEIEEPRRDLQRLRSETEAIETQHRELMERRTDRRARLDEAGALGLDRRLAELASQREATAKRLDTVARRAQAVAMLQRLFELRRRMQSHSWVEPVAQLVRSWMDRVSSGRTVSVDLDNRMLPTEVELAEVAETLPITSLSHGAREQLVVLLRLALGVALSQDERQLVVLDDRLVNADDERSSALCEILQEVAADCQILIATCRPAAYEGLEARRIEIERRGGYLEGVGSGSNAG